MISVHGNTLYAIAIHKNRSITPFLTLWSHFENRTKTLLSILQLLRTCHIASKKLNVVPSFRYLSILKCGLSFNIWLQNTFDTCILCYSLWQNILVHFGCKISMIFEICVNQNQQDSFYRYLKTTCALFSSSFANLCSTSPNLVCDDNDKSDHNVDDERTFRQMNDKR